MSYLALSLNTTNVALHQGKITKIMLVDDSVFQLTAKKNNYHDIIEVKDGEEGIKKSIAEKPDIAFLDLKIPGVNGFYVIEIKLMSIIESILNQSE